MGTCQSTPVDSIIQPTSPYYEDALKSVSPHLYRKTIEIIENKNPITYDIIDGRTSMTLPCGDPFIGQSVHIKGLRIIEILKKYGTKEFTITLLPYTKNNKKSIQENFSVHYVQKTEQSQTGSTTTNPPALTIRNQTPTSRPQPPPTSPYPRLPPTSAVRMTTQEQYQRDFGTIASDPISWNNR